MGLCHMNNSKIIFSYQFDLYSEGRKTMSYLNGGDAECFQCGSSMNKMFREETTNRIFCGQSCQYTFHANPMQIGGKVKRAKGSAKRKEEEPIPPSDSDVDAAVSLETLRGLWASSLRDSPRRDYIKNRIEMLISKGELVHQNKPIKALVREYKEKVKRLNVKYPEYKRADDEDGDSMNSRPKFITPFDDSVYFSIYYDLNSGEFKGPLSSAALHHVSLNGTLKTKTYEYAEDEGTQRALDDAKDIRKFNSDPTKIQIYSK